MMPDVEKVAVRWAQVNGPINALIAGRCATRLPKDWVSPFLRVVVIDADQDFESEFGTALLQWDAYAHAPANANPDYPAASLLARTLAHEAQLASNVLVTTSAAVAFARVSFGAVRGPVRQEEPETRWARYSVETVVGIRATEGGV